MMNPQLLDEKKAAFEGIRKEKVNGFITRLRIHWLHEGEKPTSFYCQLESKTYTNQTIGNYSYPMTQKQKKNRTK